jgi:hypothetical protein
MAYEYSFVERLIMALITGISNFGSIPVIYYLHKKGRYYETYIGTFTLITSFMYHVCESLDVEIYMEHGQWHELDNIGSIGCMISLLVSLTNVGLPFEQAYKNQIKLNFISILITLVMQIKHPWDLFNTIVPIVIFAFIMLYDQYTNGFPVFNREALKKGLTFLVIAFSMFVKGLDDENDYLRIYHSLWHVLIAISSYYIWQFQDNKIIEYTDEVVLMRKFFV